MPPLNFRFEALGTRWEITTTEPLDASLLQKVQDRIERFDATYSRFRADSLVTKMSKNAGAYDFPDDSLEITTFYRQLYDITKGKVTPLIGEVLERAGYDADYSFIPQKQKTLPAWDEVLHIEGTTFQISQPIIFDIGAAGKGYLVDEVAGILVDNGIHEFVVDASGDLIHRGVEKNLVGLEHPLKPGSVIGAINIQNRSLCASAIQRRTWGEGVHHIFDPDSLLPTKDIIATWVVADSTMLADGLATALFFTNPALLSKHFSFEYVRMHADASLDYSSDFSGELYN